MISYSHHSLEQNPIGVFNSRKSQGNWEYDLLTCKLNWTPDQYLIYGYQPSEIKINDQYFLSKTTHHSELKRVTSIIDDALKNKNGYDFKRRIIKKGGVIGFAETNAFIIRTPEGKAQKIIGTTTDLYLEKPCSVLEYNDPKFFKTMYINYYRAIKIAISDKTHDNYLAEDLCQEVFLKAWHNMSSYDPHKGELYTWLLGITNNHCKDYFRSRQYRTDKQTLSINPKFSNSTPSEIIFNEKICLMELIMKLNIHQREILELLFYQGYTQIEVAKMTNTPLGTIKSRSRAALQTLRVLIKEHS